MRTLKLLCPLAAAAALFTATPALAQQAGDWTFSLGAHVVAPKSDNGSLAGGALEADVGDNWRPTITGEYFFRDNWGIEVLASLPFHALVSERPAGSGDRYRDARWLARDHAITILPSVSSLAASSVPVMRPASRRPSGRAICSSSSARWAGDIRSPFW